MKADRGRTAALGLTLSVILHPKVSTSTGVRHPAYLHMRVAHALFMMLKNCGQSWQNVLNGPLLSIMRTLMRELYCAIVWLLPAWLTPVRERF